MDEQSEGERERERARQGERERRASLTEAGRRIRATRSLHSMCWNAGAGGKEAGTEREREREREAPAVGGTARYGSGGSFVATFYQDTQRHSDEVA